MASVHINFDPDDFATRIRAAAMAKAQEHLAAQLDGLRCEEHGKIPEIAESAGDEVTFRSCCEALQERVRERLASFERSAEAEDNDGAGSGTDLRGAPDDRSQGPVEP